MVKNCFQQIQLNYLGIKINKQLNWVDHLDVVGLRIQ